MADRDPTKVIFWVILGVLVLIGFGGYIWVVVDAGLRSLDQSDEPTISEGLTNLVTGVATALATNFGAFLGIAVEQGKLNITGLKARLKNPTVQAIASLVYLGIMITAAVFWGLDDWSDQSAAIIRNHALSLFGVAGGAVAVVLNTRAT
jgi:hypothetical protein